MKAVIDVTVACGGLFVIGNGTAQFFCGRAFSLLDTYSIWFLFDASFYGHEGVEVVGRWSELVGVGALARFVSPTLLSGLAVPLGSRRIATRITGVQ